MDEHTIGSDLTLGEFRLPLRELKSYELTQYHVYLEKRITVSARNASLFYCLVNLVIMKIEYIVVGVRSLLHF